MLWKHIHHMTDLLDKQRTEGTCTVDLKASGELSFSLSSVSRDIKYYS